MQFNIRDCNLQHRNNGAVYNDLEQYKEARVWFNRALVLAEKMEEKVLISMVFNNMGFSYARQKNEKKALRYYKKALKIKEKIGDIFGVGITLNNIGNLYRQRNDLEKSIYLMNIGPGKIQKVRIFAHRNIFFAGSVSCFHNDGLERMFDSPRKLISIVRPRDVSRHAEDKGRPLPGSSSVRGIGPPEYSTLSFIPFDVVE